jgi:peptide deformylase
MMKISINKDPILRKKSKKLEDVTEQDRNFIKKMFETMYEQNGIGLAAVQVGALKQIITIDIGQGKLCLINPMIVKKNGPFHVMEEGCLSLPDVTVKVPRQKNVTVKALDQSGLNITIDASDLMARVLQHEIDHLKGKLIVDYVPWYKKITAVMKLS